MKTMGRCRVFELGVYASLLTALTGVVLFSERPNSPVFQRLFDACHTLVSFFLVLLAVRLLRLRDPKFELNRRLLLVILVSVTAIGFALELLQFVIPGNPSVSDLVRDFAGALAGGMLCTLRFSSPPVPRSKRWFLATSIGLILVLAILPLLGSLSCRIQQSFHPADAGSFSRVCERLSWHSNPGARLRATRIEDLPEPEARSWAQRFGSHVGRVRFASRSEVAKKYASFVVRRPFGDWSMFRTLVVDAFVPDGEPLPLHLRVNDEQHDNSYADRFNTLLELQPGPNTFLIPVEEIASGPAERRMDLRAVRQVILFIEPQKLQRRLYIGALTLQ